MTAAWAGAEEFEFVIEVFEVGFLTDVFFELVNGAGCLNGLDAAAIRADQVVAMDAGEKENKVSGALMKAEASDHAFFCETLEEAEDGGLIAGFGEVTTTGEITQRHRPVVRDEAIKDCFEGFGAAKPGGFGFFQQFLLKRHLEERLLV